MINFFDFINESILGKKLDDFLSSFPFANNTIIVFDVETTGFNPRLPHVQITELSAIPVDLKTDDLGDPFVRNIKLNSETLKKMEHEKENPVVQKSRVMSVADVLKFQSYDIESSTHDEVDAAVDFKNYVESHPNVIMVAHNATFDMGFINGLLQREGIDRIKRPVIDTFKLAKVYLEPILNIMASGGDAAGLAILEKLKDKSGYVRTTLASLGSAFGVATQGSHVAINDVMQTAILLKKIIEFIQEHYHKLDQEVVQSAFDSAKRNWQKFKKKVNLQRRGIELKK
jgi:DNA polymerase III alpha subunit (gram-positive type)